MGLSFKPVLRIIAIVIAVVALVLLSIALVQFLFNTAKIDVDLVAAVKGVVPDVLTPFFKSLVSVALIGGLLLVLAFFVDSASATEVVEAAGTVAGTTVRGASGAILGAATTVTGATVSSIPWPQIILCTGVAAGVYYVWRQNQKDGSIQ